MHNRAELIGNLGCDPELSYPNGVGTVCKFRMATSEKWREKVSGEMRERTEWHRIVVFGNLAEICGKYLHKGKQIYIGGRLQTRKWVDNDDVTRYTTEIVANEMQMLGGRGGGQQSGGQAQQQQAQQPGKGGAYDDFDDDIPF